jgi:hypothetical protein
MGRIGNFIRNVGGKIKRGAQWVGRKIKEHPVLTAGAIAAGAGAIAAGKGIANGLQWAREHPELIQRYKDFRRDAKESERLERARREADRKYGPYDPNKLRETPQERRDRESGIYKHQYIKFDKNGYVEGTKP